MEPKKLPIRLVGLDLDGTVFDSRKRISPRTAQAIERACAMGVQVLPATGRPENGVPAQFLAIPGVHSFRFRQITDDAGAPRRRRSGPRCCR